MPEEGSMQVELRMDSEYCCRSVSGCSSPYSSKNLDWPHWVRRSTGDNTVPETLTKGPVEGAEVQNCLDEFVVGTFLLSWAMIHGQTLA